MAGRKPLPTNLKAVKGTLRKGRENKNEPRPELAYPAPPEHLSREALQEWGRIVPQLHQLGLLSDIDRAALAAYCQTYGRWVQAERELQDLEALLDETPNGMKQQHALVGIANTAMKLMHKYLTEFGMTPSSRARVSVPKEDSKDNNFSGFNR